jgi:hypothetical protein
VDFEVRSAKGLGFGQAWLQPVSDVSADIEDNHGCVWRAGFPDLLLYVDFSVRPDFVRGVTASSHVHGPT